MKIMGEEITWKKGVLIIGMSIVITLLLASAFSSIKSLNLNLISAIILASIVYLSVLIVGYILVKNAPNRVEYRHEE